MNTRQAVSRSSQAWELCCQLQWPALGISLACLSERSRQTYFLPDLAFLGCCLSPPEAFISFQELGVSILQDLHRQRETIVHSRDTLHGADDNIARARRTLSTMSRRVVTNKVIMAGIALLLVAAIALVVYYKFIKSNWNIKLSVLVSNDCRCQWRAIDPMADCSKRFVLQASCAKTEFYVYCACSWLEKLYYPVSCLCQHLRDSRSPWNRTPR